MLAAAISTDAFGSHFYRRLHCRSLLLATRHLFSMLDNADLI